MDIDAFARGNSFLHGLNPIVRFLIAIIFTFLIAIANRFSTLVVAFLVSYGLVFLSGVGVIAASRRMFIVSGMILVCLIFLTLTVKGPVLLTIGPLKLYQPGLVLSARIGLKSFTLVFAIIALISTIPVASLGYVMDRLLFPKKLILLLLLTYRYITVFQQEYQRLIIAARIRGFQPGNNLHTYKTYAYLVSMLFVRASIRGERVYKAMVCRGFKGHFHSIYQFKFRKSDLFFLCGMVLVLLILGNLEWNGLSKALLS